MSQVSKVLFTLLWVLTVLLVLLSVISFDGVIVRIPALVSLCIAVITSILRRRSNSGLWVTACVIGILVCLSSVYPLATSRGSSATSSSQSPIDQTVSPATSVVFSPPTTLGSRVWSPDAGMSLELAQSQLKLRTIPLQVRMWSGVNRTLSSEVHVTIDNSPTNPIQYHKSYDLSLGSVAVANLSVLKSIQIPVPPMSGEYEVNSSARFTRWLFNTETVQSGPLTVYTDHGGFYRQGTLSVHLSKTFNGLVYTLNQVRFSPQNTVVHFTITRANGSRSQIGYGYGAVVPVRTLPVSSSFFIATQYFGMPVGRSSTTYTPTELLGPPTPVSFKALEISFGNPIQFAIPLSSSNGYAQ